MQSVAVMTVLRVNIIAVVMTLSLVYVSSMPKNLRKPGDNGYPFPFYTRDAWLAAPAKDVIPLTTPVPYVVIHHTYIPGACNTTKQCSADMRAMQNYHNSLEWGDIGYNFCVGSEGGAYEGRGWHNAGIHAGRANNVSIGICLIGDWRHEIPPQQQLDTTNSLIAVGVDQGVVSPDYKLIGHKQAMNTECPGSALFQHISHWDHFAPGHFEKGA